MNQNENKQRELAIMKAVALCYKPYLKPEEAMIYTNLGEKQMRDKFHEFGIFKSSAGYYKREDIDRLLAGEQSIVREKSSKVKI